MSTTPHAAVASKEIVEQIYLGARHIGLPRTVPPCVFSDDELRRVAAPTLLLIGDHEIFHTSTAAARAASDPARRDRAHPRRRARLDAGLA